MRILTVFASLLGCTEPAKAIDAGDSGAPAEDPAPSDAGLLEDDTSGGRDTAREEILSWQHPLVRMEGSYGSTAGDAGGDCVPEEPYMSLPINARQIVPLPDGRWALINSSSIVIYDIQSDKSETIGSNIWSHVSAAVWDPIDEQLIVADYGGRGSLYAVDVDAKTVEVRADMNNIDVMGMVYHPDEDVIYAIEANAFQISRFQPNGLELDPILLHGDEHTLGQKHSPVQLMLTTDGLIAITGLGRSMTAYTISMDGTISAEASCP